jgi:hypothetical protein
MRTQPLERWVINEVGVLLNLVTMLCVVMIFSYGSQIAKSICLLRDASVGTSGAAHSDFFFFEREVFAFLGAGSSSAGLVASAGGSGAFTSGPAAFFPRLFGSLAGSSGGVGGGGVGAADCPDVATFSSFAAG